jgi:hypothetical protein
LSFLPAARFASAFNGAGRKPSDKVLLGDEGENDHRQDDQQGQGPTTSAELEDQMCAFTTDFDRARAGYSPDRVDALVWALTELLVEPMPNFR